MKDDLPAELRQAIEEFEKLQDEYTSAGAGDTEPDGVFHVVIHRAIKGAAVDWETLDWELYDSPGTDRRTRELAEKAKPLLTAAAQKVYDLVRRYNDSRKIVAALRDYAWRCSA